MVPKLLSRCDKSFDSATTTTADVSGESSISSVRTAARRYRWATLSSGCRGAPIRETQGICRTKVVHNESMVWMRRRPGCSLRRQWNMSFRARAARANFQVNFSCGVSGSGPEAL